MSTQVADAKTWPDPAIDQHDRLTGRETAKRPAVPGRDGPG